MAMIGTYKTGVNVHAILYAIVTWVLLQLLVVWFCARLAAVRELYVKDYLLLQEYLVRSGLDAHAHQPAPRPSPAGPPDHRVPPAGVARA